MPDVDRHAGIGGGEPGVERLEVLGTRDARQRHPVAGIDRLVAVGEQDQPHRSAIPHGRERRGDR